MTLKRAIRILISLPLGFLIGVLVHYALYRMSLPVEPFIYMSF
jgi:hypothetical protein